MRLTEQQISIIHDHILQIALHVVTVSNKQISEGVFTSKVNAAYSAFKQLLLAEN